MKETKQTARGKGRRLIKVGNGWEGRVEWWDNVPGILRLEKLDPKNEAIIVEVVRL